MLNKHKINYKSYVLFFLRDEEYWGKDKLNQIRNSNIENFFPLIKLFIENQITVIRLEDLTYLEKIILTLNIILIFLGLIKILNYMRIFYLQIQK